MLSARCRVSSTGAPIPFFLRKSASTFLLTPTVAHRLVILITYLRFYYGLKRQGFDRRDLAYQAPLQPYASYFGAFMMTIIIIFNSYQVFLRYVDFISRFVAVPCPELTSARILLPARSSSWDTGTFITGYICIPVFFILMLGYKVRRRRVSLPALAPVCSRCPLPRPPAVLEEDQVRPPQRHGL